MLASMLLLGDRQLRLPAPPFAATLRVPQDRDLRAPRRGATGSPGEEFIRAPSRRNTAVGRKVLRNIPQRLRRRLFGSMAAAEDREPHGPASSCSSPRGREPRSGAGLRLRVNAAQRWAGGDRRCQGRSVWRARVAVAKHCLEMLSFQCPGRIIT